MKRNILWNKNLKNRNQTDYAIVNCNVCNKFFTVEVKEMTLIEDGKKLCKEPVIVRALQCPNCKKIYIVSVMTKSMVLLSKRITGEKQKKRLQERERKLRQQYIQMFNVAAGKENGK